MTNSHDSETTNLYLLRHGSTDANEQRPYILQGRSIDLPLNEQGRRQSEALAGFMQPLPLSRVYCSTMKRAEQTAQAVAKPHGLEICSIAGLQECDVGQWEGMDWGSIMQQYPAEYQAFIENPADIPYLGGESYNDVLRRARMIIGNLLLRHRGESIAIVAHNVVNRSYLAYLLGLDMNRARHLDQTNTCVNVIRYRRGESSLTTMNAAFHLDCI
jgi:broad specificity phosphatase PhoE